MADDGENDLQVVESGDATKVKEKFAWTQEDESFLQDLDSKSGDDILRFLSQVTTGRKVYICNVVMKAMVKQKHFQFQDSARNALAEKPGKVALFVGTSDKMSLKQEQTNMFKSLSLPQSPPNKLADLRAFVRAAVVLAKDLNKAMAAPKYAGLQDKNLRARIALLYVEPRARETLERIFAGDQSRAALDDPSQRRTALWESLVTNYVLNPDWKPLEMQNEYVEDAVTYYEFPNPNQMPPTDFTLTGQELKTMWTRISTDYERCLGNWTKSGQNDPTPRNFHLNFCAGAGSDDKFNFYVFMIWKKEAPSFCTRLVPTGQEMDTGAADPASTITPSRKTPKPVARATPSPASDSTADKWLEVATLLSESPTGSSAASAAHGRESPDSKKRRRELQDIKLATARQEQLANFSTTMVKLVENAQRLEDVGGELGKELAKNIRAQILSEMTKMPTSTPVQQDLAALPPLEL